MVEDMRSHPLVATSVYIDGLGWSASSLAMTCVHFSLGREINDCSLIHLIAPEGVMTIVWRYAKV